MSTWKCSKCGSEEYVQYPLFRQATYLHADSGEVIPYQMQVAMQFQCSKCQHFEVCDTFRNPENE